MCIIKYTVSLRKEPIDMIKEGMTKIKIKMKINQRNNKKRRKNSNYLCKKMKTDK